MSTEVPDLGSPQDWMRHARSDLKLAKTLIEGVMLESLCFHAQQTAEKAIKAVLVERGVQFPYTHNLSVRIAVVQESGVDWPDEQNSAARLTKYAAQLRYPSLHGDVSAEDHREAVELATVVVEWVDKLIV